MGACLEYAARKGMPLMMYVFSDGSLSSNGMVDNSIEWPRQGRVDERQPGHGVAVLPRLQPGPSAADLRTGAAVSTAAQHQQLGSFSADGNVLRAATPGANNVNLLVETVLLNYMALHRSRACSAPKFPNNGLGDATSLDRLTALAPICNGLITNPV